MGKIDYLNLRRHTESEIKKNGGWINAHAHIDRAFTLNEKLYNQANKYRHEKWKLNAYIRKTSSVNQIYDRMAKATELLLNQGTSAIGTFIDVDPDVKDKAIRAAQKLREKYKKSMVFKFINQTSYGVLTKPTREWFEIGADFADIIGGLLKANQGKENQVLDIVLGTAKNKGKMVHMHVDELNLPEEHETELLAEKNN